MFRRNRDYHRGYRGNRGYWRGRRRRPSLFRWLLEGALIAGAARIIRRAIRGY